MSEDNPAARAVPPRWMPVGEEPELCSAGEWWDAVRAMEAVGRRAIEILSEGDKPVGPVILDHEGPEPRLYFLVPVGTAARWREPGTVALGQKCHVVVPSTESTTPPGMHWHIFPRNPRSLNQPDVLHRALSRARREQQGSAEEAAP
ncbi:hypothetical protein [Streptomyces griseiscabiei]|uniref:Uncharacterized protein n=1 Tax=Streptomyces griseiscabiei TaxID=2993540 RepID=A0ABU4KXT5_9ACTN|nr:hypothetical protein [Streptomyces griseiscabiei]MBZ3904521.1 hypothetical protein [Streptomyces griseiscabiei]MDX2908270.1 hypothetical protein [Streptomyces griseiscabiei]